MEYFKNKFFFSDKLKFKVDEIEDNNIKDYMIIRYLSLVKRLEIHTLKTSLFYYFLSLNITFGSILVPPLLTIDENYFWPIFSISLVVTSSNAIIKLFHLDKFYITRNIRLNQFKSEGIFFLTKVPPYDNMSDQENFKLFVKNVEKLKREHILEEYTQNREENEDHMNNSTAFI